MLSCTSIGRLIPMIVLGPKVKFEPAFDLAGIRFEGVLSERQSPDKRSKWRKAADQEKKGTRRLCRRSLGSLSL